MQSQISHEYYMTLALELAQRGRGHTAPNPMVGCVIVKNNQVIATGYHQKAGCNHAEVNAIETARFSQTVLKDSTVYATLEPCCHTGKTGPCTEALIKAEVKTIVIAMLDPNPLVSGKGISLLQAAGIEIILGVCESQAQKINPGFISRITKNRPYIRSKIAASLDGRVALQNGESKWITNELCRQDGHLLRYYSDAIVTTANTVLADDPMLTVRNVDIGVDIGLIDKQPLRVVIDRNLVTNPSYKVFQEQDLAKTVLITSNLADKNNSNNLELLDQFKANNITVYSLENLDMISNLWTFLGELGCNDVLVESGGKFNGYLLANQLVDEWIIYQSGLIMGSDAQSMFGINNLGSMSGLFKLKCEHIKQIDSDWRLTLKSL
ncbi:MAG: bifunctional diaminohydroxyphosphoribosylaminopyrimidine deaminase/5-amino-6-(5-phosphoribosylamino)uracil reductase RibD [Gammaproteobacteria bacterium]|nr:bifunctional diaminohydroxyphosphoribosylaminopyrimidine deaminase/5-amino-6-(5-phosphoribosylamino)uracil reductase RibD [Gammaproteobacteria bacterium]